VNNAAQAEWLGGIISTAVDLEKDLPLWSNTRYRHSHPSPVAKTLHGMTNRKLFDPEVSS
jgi:hypothetical protein